jgi:hypothetical protein
MLVVFTALNFFVAPLLALMAFFVQDYLRLGPDWLGYLYACYGAGGLIGFALAGMLRVKGRGREALLAGATIGQSATIPLMLLLPVAWLVSRGHWWTIVIPLVTAVPLTGTTPPIAYPLAYWVTLVAVVVEGRRLAVEQGEGSIRGGDRPNPASVH